MAGGRWFYSRARKCYGPFGPEELQPFVASGKLLADDLVWMQGMAGWEPAKDALKNIGEYLSFEDASDVNNRTARDRPRSVQHDSDPIDRASTNSGLSEASPCVPPPLPEPIDIVDTPIESSSPIRVGGFPRIAITSAALLSVLLVAFWFLGVDNPRLRLSGIVSFRGSPVAQGRVVLCDSRSGRSYTTMISPVGFYEFHASKKAGVREGEYAISILPPIPEVVMDVSTGTAVVRKCECPEIPEHYRKPSTSGLIVQVPPRGGVVFKIDMK
jgi:hypothetical protein